MAAAAPPVEQTAASAEHAQLSAISGVVGTLHSQAAAMNSELRSQSVAIDQAVDASDRQKAEMKKNTGRSKKLGGGWF